MESLKEQIAVLKQEAMVQKILFERYLELKYKKPFNEMNPQDLINEYKEIIHEAKIKVANRSNDFMEFLDFRNLVYDEATQDMRKENISCKTH